MFFFQQGIILWKKNFFFKYFCIKFIFSIAQLKKDLPTNYTNFHELEIRNWCPAKIQDLIADAPGGGRVHQPFFILSHIFYSQDI